MLARLTGRPYLGQILALLASIRWSIVIILFREPGEIVSPPALNQFKNLRPRSSSR